MSASTPPSLPRRGTVALSRRTKFLLGFTILVGVAVVIALALRAAGLLRPFKIPAGSMAPAVATGDHIFMEGISYKWRHPQRGDIAVFKTDAMPAASPGTFYTKRIAGEPGDRLRIADEKLYVNDKHVPLRNEKGEIRYVVVRGGRYLTSSNDTVTVPEGHYFMLGDNSANSADSRYLGFVPARDIKGRVFFCYWPPNRIGTHE